MNKKITISEGFLINEIQGLIKPNNLILLNDHDNTFDSVMVALMDVCEHTREQAEQCSVITHYHGKCAVKKGSYVELKYMQEALQLRGIETNIE
jgi:ATP-dependent Clp protease adaptor protein ClpS